MDQNKQFKLFMRVNSGLYLITILYCLFAFNGYLPIFVSAVLIFLIAGMTALIYIRFKKTLGFGSVLTSGKSAFWFALIYCILLVLFGLFILFNIGGRV